MSVLFNESENINFRHNDYPELHTVKDALVEALENGGSGLENRVTVLESEMEDTAKHVDIAPEFSDATNYSAGDLVYYDGELYRFTVDHDAGEWDAGDAALVDISMCIDDLKPVDAVTNGVSKAVTSNAVYDYLNGSVYVARESGETVKSFFNRVYAAIDKSKLTPFTKLATNSGSIYPLSSQGSSGIYFSKSSVTYGSGNITEQNTQIRFHETDSTLKHVDFSTGAGSGSGNAVAWSMGDQTDSTSSGPSSIEIYYR